MRIFPKIASIAKRPVKVTNTALMFIEVEQLAVYQFLPHLTIWKDLG